MVWFTSARERRLWSLTAALLVAIYAAAILAGSLVDALGSEVLLGVTFAAAFGLAVVAVVGIALSGRPRAEIWVALGVAVAYLMIPVRSGVPALERTHLFEYGLLAVLLYEALIERRSNGIVVRLPAATAIAIATLMGWLDEAVQAFVPNRIYDLRDVAINALAAVIAVTALAVLRWGRARITPEQTRPDADARGESELHPH